MNPLTLVMLAEWLSDLINRGKQVVVTTHSLEAVNALTSIEDRAKVVRINRRDGVLETEYYSGDEIDELKKLGIDVRV